MAAQLSKKPALPLAQILATASCLSSKTGSCFSFIPTDLCQCANGVYDCARNVRIGRVAIKVTDNYACWNKHGAVEYDHCHLVVDECGIHSVQYNVRFTDVVLAAAILCMRAFRTSFPVWISTKLTTLDRPSASDAIIQPMASPMTIHFSNASTWNFVLFSYSVTSTVYWCRTSNWKASWNLFFVNPLTKGWGWGWGWGGGGVGVGGCRRTSRFFQGLWHCGSWCFTNRNELYDMMSTDH